MIVSNNLKVLLCIIKKNVFCDGSSISFNSAFEEVKLSDSELSIIINFSLFEKDDFLRNFKRSLIVSTFISLSTLFFWIRKKLGCVLALISL